MKHTPGPWVWGNYIEEVEPDNPEACELVAYGPENAAGESAVFDILALDENCSINPADARLIAAAPELLEACKKLASWAGCAIDDPASSEYYRTALAAIAKAEGKP